VNASNKLQVVVRHGVRDSFTQMKKLCAWAAGVAAVLFVSGCASIPPGAERGPHGTIAYDVLIEASEPGARIEANGEHLGNTPLRLKIFGDTDGTFHDFGSYHYVIRAFPLHTNQFPQVRFFRTGRSFTPQDRIPERIFFDMNQNTPVYAPPGPVESPVYVYPPPVYYGPPFYGPSFRFHIGPRFHRHW
jgi:hypothetical protein